MPRRGQYSTGRERPIGLFSARSRHGAAGDTPLLPARGGVLPRRRQRGKRVPPSAASGSSPVPLLLRHLRVDRAEEEEGVAGHGQEHQATPVRRGVFGGDEESRSQCSIE